MAAEMFATFSDFKAMAGGRINQSVKLESLEPIIHEAARRHIVPYLGQTLYDTLVANSGLSADQLTLHTKVQRALALISIWEYAKTASIEFGESGMHRVETESRKSAYRYQEREYKESVLTAGYNALEEVLLYLDSLKGSTFTAWAATDEGLSHISPLLNYAKDFRLLTQPECDRYTYECIKPIINQVELLSIQRQLPVAFWTGFVTRHMAGTLTTPEKALRTLIRKAIAHRSIDEAVRQQWVKVTQGRVAIAEDFGDQRNTNLTMPTGTGGSMFQRHQSVSDMYNAEWVAYMKANPTDFATAFDEDSGGSSTATDAWHINSTAEQEDADAAIVARKKKPVFQM